MSDQQHQITTLDNGLRIISETFPHVRSVALGIMMGVGSRNEAPDQAGLSHFLEHLLFKGTDRISSTEIDVFFDGIGAEVNASTDKEVTTVYARFLDKHLEKALDTMSDMAMRSTFPDIDSERQVVIEEIAMYEDEPSDKVHEILGGCVFGDTPLGRPIIGTAEVVGGVSVPSISAYRDSQYVPGNIVVAAAGSVDHEKLVELVKQAGFDRAGSEPGFDEAPVDEGPKVGFFKKDTEQVHITLGARGLARADDRRFTLTLIDTILGGSMASRLFQEVREKRGLAYAIYSYSGYYRDAGQLGIYVGTRPDRVEEAMATIGVELHKIAEDPATPEEFARVKEYVKGKTALSMESPMGRMSQLGRSLLLDVPILSLDEIEERIDAVTMDGMRAMAAEFYDPSQFSAAAVGPDEDTFRRALEPVNPQLVTAAA